MPSGNSGKSGTTSPGIVVRVYVARGPADDRKGARPRATGLEIAAGTVSGRPIFARGCVTITDLVTPDDPATLNAWFDDLDAGLAGYGHEGRTWVRAAGRDAQRAFWRDGTVGRLSVLHQLARHVAP